MAEIMLNMGARALNPRLVCERGIEAPSGSHGPSTRATVRRHDALSVRWIMWTRKSDTGRDTEMTNDFDFSLWS